MATAISTRPRPARRRRFSARGRLSHHRRRRPDRGRRLARGQRRCEGIAAGSPAATARAGGEGAARGSGWRQRIDDAFGRRVEIASYGGDGGRSGALLHLHQFDQGGGLEGALPGEDLVEQQAEGADDRFGRSLRCRPIARSVTWRAVEMAAWRHGRPCNQPSASPARSEIHDDDLAAAVDHHIGGFRWVAVRGRPFSVGRRPTRRRFAGLRPALSDGQASGMRLREGPRSSPSTNSMEM